jgi:hypothetical protein
VGPATLQQFTVDELPAPQRACADHFLFPSRLFTKKIYYRGSSIKPRDIFDIAAAGERHADPVIDALRGYRTEVQTTLMTIDRLNPDFVNNAIAQLSVKDRFRSVVKTALQQAKQLLRAV